MEKRLWGSAGEFALALPAKVFPVFPKIKATRGAKEIEVLDGVDSDNIGGKKKQTASGSLIKPFAT